MFSWDNASIHGNVRKGQWDQDGITVADHTLLPPYSPDMHNVIELCHANITRALQEEVNSTATAESPELDAPAWCAKLQQIFAQRITHEWVCATLKRMYAVTLPAILEAKGHWPSKEYR